MLNRKRIIILTSSVIAVSAIGTLALLVTNGVIRSPLAPVNIVLVDQTTLDGLTKKNGSAANVDHIDSALIPPTNSWISGMVLQPTPLPVYTMPLSFLAKDNGFEIGLPTVQSTAKEITGQHTPGIIVDIDTATGFKLSRFDKVSATLKYSTQTKQLGSLTLAEGSPYVFYHAAETTTLHISGMGTVASGGSPSYLRYTKAGRDYAVVASGNAHITVNGSMATLTAPKDGLLTFYALPDTKNDTLRDLAANEITSVAVSNSVDATTQTTFNYKTANNQSTVFAPMAYSTVTKNDATVGTYDSIYGPMKAVKGTSFTTSVTTTKPDNTLDLSHLSDAHKQQLIASLQTDVSNTTITAQDSYFAGKQLARAATLLDISEQLGQVDTSARLKSILTDGFAKRLNSEYLYYDSILKGIAAQTKAFGSEDFNDHHFHYGYFIYAASIFGKYDADFMKTSEKQINLLVADIAAYTLTSNFPIERNYDPYAGHSWAAGLSPFADGNNQESSSEAVNAWNGVALWGDLTKNTQLKDSAAWMLSNEAATAKAAWRTVDTSPSYLKNFTSPLTSLNFGGKRTYSTFFSDAANAKLGIQLLPLSPAMLSYASDGGSIDATVKASIQGDNYNVALGDYVLMYLALHDPQKAAQLTGKQQDAFIDDGNSRTYMNAWVFSLSDK
ncbi:MAG TPA: glycosyl hydrolase [Candidatus Microsaccharimonas sp.]|jgi:endoglucanase Acf2